MTTSIWFQKLTLAQANKRGKNTMIEHLGIKFTEIGDDFLKATMPVDHRTHQTDGILHGGASVALAETLGSSAAYLMIDPSAKHCVGIEINANHVRSCTQGLVEGVARPLHLGRSTQVWEIQITQNEQLICVSRLTLATLNK